VSPAPDRVLERALAAKRESRRVAFRTAVDPRDVVAMANSGGGVILLDAFDVAGIPDEIADFEVRRIDDRFALIVGEAASPIVLDGVVWVRRGTKTAPATTQDLDEILRRRMKKTIFTVLRPQPAVPPLSDSVPIRIVDDLDAPSFRVVDHDRTHPFRQKEVLEALRSRLSMPLNQFDLQAVRHMLKTDDNPDFSHKPVFGTRQYSQKFIDWLVEKAEKDPQFFAKVRDEYIRSRKGGAAGFSPPPAR
jgi:hypothetical protein